MRKKGGGRLLRLYHARYTSGSNWRLRPTSADERGRLRGEMDEIVISGRGARRNQIQYFEHDDFWQRLW